MNKFWVLAFRNLWVRKARTFITASGIMLGVAAMLAVSVMSATTTQSLRDFFAQSSGRASLTITDSGSTGQGFPQRTLHRVQQFDGVADVVGTTGDRVTLLAKDKVVPLTVVGIDPDVDQRVRTYTLTSGQFLSKREKAQNILLVAKFASDHDIAVGDTIALQVAGSSDLKFKTIGLLADEGAGHLNGGRVGFVNLDVAETVFNRGSRLDQIDLVAQPHIVSSPSELNRLKSQLQDTLGDKYLVALPTATGESVSQALAGLNLGMSIFSIIALFVGMLLIYNTFAMTVAERTREIGLFRSIGTTRRQVLMLVLIEASILGLIGTAMGVACGLLLSIPLVRLMTSLIGLPLESFTIPPSGLIQAAVVGLITTFVAAFLPAWQASRVPPTEALRSRAGGREGVFMRHGWKIGLVLIAIATVDGTGIYRISQGSSFFITTFTGTILLMPTIILMLERVGRRLIGLVYGPVGQLGSQNLARSRARTSLTVGVLMIGVVMNVAIGAMSTSFKASIDDWINAAIGGDFVVSSIEPLHDDLARELAAVQGISAVTAERLLQHKVVGTTAGGQSTTRDDSVLAVGIDPETYTAVSSFQFTGGEDRNSALTDLAAGDSIFISTVLRDRWKVLRGDLVRLRTARGEQDFRIAATVAMFWQGGQSFIISRRAMEKYFGDTRVSFFMLKKSPDASSADVEQRLKEGIAKSRHLEVQAGQEYRQNFATQIQQFFTLFDAMVWIAVLVGALGVINTMTMNILERGREIGTLRSIGMSRLQLAWMVLAEAGAMGVLGSVFGVAIAVPVSRVMVTGMSQSTGFPVSYIFPSAAFVVGVIIALIVSQLAALYPTWRAGRVNIVEAIRSE